MVKEEIPRVHWVCEKCDCGADRPAYIFAGALVFVPAIVMMTAIAENPLQPIVLLTGAYIVVALVWILSYRLAYSANTLRYRSLFSGRREIEFDDIASARIEFGSFGYSDRFRPTTRLVVVPKAVALGKPIVINLKVFRRTCVDGLLDRLHANGVLK